MAGLLRTQAAQFTRVLQHFPATLATLSSAHQRELVKLTVPGTESIHNAKVS